MPPNKKRLSRRERRLERKRLEIERKRLNFLEYLHREIKYGNITRKRYDKRWKELITKLALERIRADLEYTWQMCDWALDVKDCVISAYMDDLKRANDQSALSWKNHNAQIELCMRHYQDSVNSLQDDYLKTLENMKTYHKKQYEDYTNVCDYEEKKIGIMLFRMEQTNAENVKEQMAEYFIRIESCTDDAAIVTQHLETNFDKKIRKLWSRYNDSFNEYFSTHKKKMNEFQKCNDAYDSSTNKNDKNLRKIIYLVDLLKILQAKLTFLYDTHGKELRSAEDNFEKFRKILYTLGNKITSDIELDDTHTKLLISCSIKTLDYLSRILRKGEIVLKLMRCGRKYETSNEKVLPYHAYNIHRRELMNSEVKLIFFHVKMANVDASRVALNEEKKVLQLENLLLKSKLEEYCIGYPYCSSKIKKSTTNQHRTNGNSFYQCGFLKKYISIPKLNLECDASYIVNFKNT